MSLPRSGSSNYLRAPESNAEGNAAANPNGDDQGLLNDRLQIWRRAAFVMGLVATASLIALIIVSLDCDSDPTDDSSACDGDSNSPGINCRSTLNCCMSENYLAEAERVKFAMSEQQSELFDGRNVVAIPFGSFPSLSFELKLYTQEKNNNNNNKNASLPNEALSFWFDVPFRSSNPDEANVVAMICEIPRGARAKMEVTTGAGPAHPIRQDLKNGELRYNIFGEYSYNYGAIPQTWENDTKTYYDTGYVGDGDPIDVYDLSMRPCAAGQIYPVKILGAIGLIDSGEIDWKILAIAKGDPYYPLLDDVSDVDLLMPRAVDSLVEFLRYYKTCNAGVPNEFYGNPVKNAATALEIVEDGHKEWLSLSA